jgi:hypothetical protein
MQGDETEKSLPLALNEINPDQDPYFSRRRRAVLAFIFFSQRRNFQSSAQMAYKSKRNFSPAAHPGRKESREEKFHAAVDT